MPVQVGKYSTEIYFGFTKAFLIFNHTPLNFMNVLNIFYVLHIFLSCPHSFLSCPHSFLCSPGKLFTVQKIFLLCGKKEFTVQKKKFTAWKIFSNPIKHLGIPQNLLFFMHRFFGTFLFWNAGLP